MEIFGIHIADLIVLLIYFGLVLFLGAFLGTKQTKKLGDFYVAGSKWGAVVSFIFVFASALAGNEAVVVSGKAYHVGLSGVWYWWSFLFATPVYYLFSTYYRRARVYNIAEFFEMRYGTSAAALYSILACAVSILFMGIILLAVGKILVGVTSLPLQVCIWTIVLIVGAYVFSGGMMSALLTDLLQGVMCILILGFVMLPFVWRDAGGLESLKALPVETWDFTSEGMPLLSVVALNISAIIGGIAGPWMLPWIAISKDERAAAQCGWGHLGKRIATVLFTLYGILFAICLPNLADPEQAWGIMISTVLPAGVGLVGLLIASFFAAGMSSVDTYATTSSSMAVDFFYRRILRRGRSMQHYLTRARCWAVISIAIGAVSTLFIDSIADYVKIWIALLSFLGVPIFFGVAWRRANRLGMWLALSVGTVSYLVIMIFMTGEGRCFENHDAALPWGVFIPTGLAIAGMYFGSYLGRQENPVLLNRFYVIMNTPIGKEQRLVKAGIILPALVDAGLAEDGPEQLRPDVLENLCRDDSQYKLFGADSLIELHSEPTLPWYFPGFIKITLSCIGLIILTWLITRILFVWPVVKG